MNAIKNIPVLICGAGPTGLTLASYLQRLKVPFRIVDKNEFSSAQSRALIVQARTLELFQQLGLIDKALEASGEVHCADIYSLGDKLGHINFEDDKDDSMPFPYSCVLPQDVTEKILIEDLVDKGIEIEWNSEVKGITQLEESVMLEIQKANGQTEKIQADYLIGCDGAHSVVRHAMNSDFVGGSYDSSFMLCDVEIDWEIENKGLTMMFEEDHFSIIMPFKDGKKYRIITMLPTVHEEADFNFFKTYMEEQSSIKMKLGKADWTSVYKVHHRCVDNFRKERMILAGDAAHIHSPAGGQGMNTGIQDAHALAWRLALLYHGKANQGILDQYHKERWRVAQHLVHGTDQGFKIMSSQNPSISWLRTHVMAPLIGQVFGIKRLQHWIFHFLSQTGINYEHFHEKWDLVDHSLFKSGHRFPWSTLKLKNGKDIYSLLKPDKFTLFVFDMLTEHDQEEINEELGEYNDILNVHVFSMIYKQEIFFQYHISSTLIILVRPDMHIACVVNEMEDVKKCFQEILNS